MPEDKTKGVVPLLRFPEFRDAGPWEVKRLGELGPVSMCKRVMKAQTAPTGDVPFYKIGTFGNRADAYISRNLYEEFKSKYSFPKKGDILISAAGTIGRTVVYDGKPAYFQDSNIVWIANDEEIATNEFLRFAYQKIKWKTDDNTIARLYNDSLRNIKVAIPTFSEQQKIADCLSSLDDLIRAEGERLEALKEHKKGLMQRLFPVEGQTTPDLRFPEFRDAGPWEVKRLGEYVEQKSGNSKLIKGKLYPEPRDDRFPGFSASGQDVWLDTYEQEGPAIIVSAVGARCGRCFLANGKWSAIANTHILFPKPNVIDIRFLFETVTREGFWVISGSGQPFIKVRESLLQKVSLPALPEQIKIADCLSSLDNLIRAQETRIDALKQHKKGLMQQLFVSI